MRELKFRGLHPYTKTIMDVAVIDWMHDKVYFEQGTDVAYPIDECNLMQFTGLSDKNGTYIYEGDVLKVTTKRNGTYKAKVESYQGIFGFFNSMCQQIENPDDWDKPYSKTDSGWFLSGFSNLAGFDYSKLDECDYHGNQLCCEVIGNIHQNPELLSGE